MSNDDNVVKLIQPGILTDRLTEVLRDGARVLLTQAVEAEVSEFLAATADLKTDEGCRRSPHASAERQIMTASGPWRCASRGARPGGGRRRSGRIRFTRHPATLRPAFEEPRYTDPDLIWAL